MFPTLKTSGLFYINDQYLTSKLPEIAFPEDDIPDYVMSIRHALSVNAECELEAEIDASSFNRLFGVDLSGAQSFSTEFSEPYQEQRRKHKKKRINKKWAKRYGYVTKFRKWRIKEMTFTGDNNLEFEVLGKNIEYITRF